ncbi:MAX gene-associated protein-like [Heteronotia binoei]|uniref:MAX gene-associated protein-like n=1 Tax=Heteronotia binoei TaxID=13085 RepID=UPI00292F278B|nr:MAX gene-associated protein-like [Heteronotia binoei]
MENQPVVLGNQDGGAATGTAPAFYVLVKQPQTNGKVDQGNLVSNRDSCGVASNATVPVKSKVKTCLPADCTSGGITVTLDNNTMWNEFYHRNTEMILTKQGRRMFPYCRYWITGLEFDLKYILVMDISPVDNYRYKWNGHSWEPSGKAEPHVLGRVFIHPESPSTGHYWMHQPVSFYKLKLTNNTLDQEGHIILHSMHRYLPRLHLVPADKATEVIQLNGPDVRTFTFPQTEFFAVTAYQNIQITQLKIDYNPFAKGFRDDGLSTRPQRDVKQNGNSEHEGGSVVNSPGNCRHSTEADDLYPEQRNLEPSSGAVYNTDLERELFSSDPEFLSLTERDAHISDMPALKQEALESPVGSPSQNRCHVPSPQNSNGGINIVVKEEPVDEYDYGSSTCLEGINVKQEEGDEEYSSNDDSRDKQLKKHSEICGKEMEIESNKRTQNSQLGVAKAKMLKLETGKMPVVYLEPCTITRNTVKVSGLSQSVLSPSKSEKLPFSYSVDSLSTCFANSDLSGPFTNIKSEEIGIEQISENSIPDGCSSARDTPWEAETYSSLTVTRKASTHSFKAVQSSGLSSAKDTLGEKNTSAFKTPLSCEDIAGNKKVVILGPRKRGRPRKIKQSEVGQALKFTERSIAAGTYTSSGPCSTHLDVKPDLEDVDGVLFVSFASKEALDIHTVDGAEEREDLQNTQTPSLAPYDAYSDPDGQRIQQLEKELLEDLKSFKYKQVIHPSLQEVGLKLNFVDPTMSIDLKYLGVQLPLSYSNDCPLWKTFGTNSCSADAGLPFVSRTGKTNDITKIKGWRGKLHTSKNEGSFLDASLKNRSAFCSDKLDEYLENEGKLMETNMGFSPSTSSGPVVYQLPTKSTSYVRTLDSVLKKQSTITPSGPYTSKPLSVTSVSRKKRKKIKTKKQAISRSKGKPSFVTKQKCNLSVSQDKVTKSQSSSHTAEVGALIALSADEAVQGKQIPVRQAQQQHQNSRPPNLSKTQLKLMDLEDCALWDGKSRTYITEERADLSLTTLLTAQASLKNKPLHKIIKKRAPPCNNDFCRLGCICSSLALEKRQPAHCRKPDCMFGCTCLKRRVVLVKGGSKHKKVLEKSLPRRHWLYHGKEEQRQEETEKEEEQGKLKDKKRKKKIEYTICDSEPEKPVKNFPLWVKVDGEMDPEPVYIPTPSAIEPTKLSVPPTIDVLPSDKPVPSEAKPAPSVVKPRVYTPRPNPVIREEDKDPVYLYFESMMTCARVRIYERKMQEKKQQKCLQNSEKLIEKEHSELQPLKMEDGKESGEKSWWFSCSAGDPSTSYVHHTTPNGTTKLIEIISDCNWEEDRNEILNILSQHIKDKIPKSLKVGNFAIDLESESKTWDEKNTPIYSSRVKISMPSCQNKEEKVHMPVLETPNNILSPCKRTEKVTVLSPGSLTKLREQKKKGLPFYTGLFPAGKLAAYTCKSNLNPSCLIQVNGKNYPQAKLLLGQMGALHPANRLAAYITGRLQPTVLDLSTLSTVVSKVPSNPKVGGSEPQSVDVSTSNTTKTQVFTSSSGARRYGHAPAQRHIAARPSVDSLPSQLIMNAVGALQQKIPGVKILQPLTGPQKFNIKSTPLFPSTSAITIAATDITVTSPPVTASSHSEATCSSGTALANSGGKSENSYHTTASPTTTMATVTITKSTGIAAPIATVAFPKSVVATSTVPVSAAPLSSVLTTASPATVTTPVSTADCVRTIPSGIQTSPLPNQKPDATPLSPVTSPPRLSPGAEKRMGPRLLLIPVHQGSPALRPPQNTPLAQGKRMILQPLRNPGGVNLYRHPNGQIIQLVPLHQLQPAGPQPNLPPVMFRNPGSVVGIQLPGPSKFQDASVCQSTSVTSVTTTATSVLSMNPSPPLASLTTETPLALAVTPTTTATPMLPAPHSSLSTFPTTGASSALSVLPATEASSVLPASSSTEATSMLLAPPTIVDPLMSPTSSSTGATSALLPSPSVNQTLQTHKSVPALPVSATQGTPVIPPVLVPLSQAGTLTLRISPSGLKSTASETGADSKIVGQPSSTSSLVPLQTGSFSLLQFPGQKSASDSMVKQVGSFEVKNNSERDKFHAVHIEEKTSYTKAVEAIESDITVSNIKMEENDMPAKRTDSHSEGIICNRNVVALEVIERDADNVEKLSSGAPSSQPDAVSSDHSYLGEKIKCDEIKLKIKKKQNLKHSEGTHDEVPYSSENVSEDITNLEGSNEEQTQSVKTQHFATNSGGAEQTHLEMEEMFVDVQSQKPWGKHKIHMESREKLQKKTKSPLSQCEKKDLKALWRNRKPNGDNVTAVERGREEEKGKPKVNSAKTQNDTSRKKCVDSAQESLAKRDADFQVNCSSSAPKTITTGFQEDGQTVKDSLSQISRPCSKTSTRSVSLENQNMDADQCVDKLVRCTKQSTVKTNHCRKDCADIIDITMDDTDNDEKTDDSADETVDDISGYRSEDVVNIETLNESESSEGEDNVDIETVEELSEKINIARLKASAAHALLSKQLHIVHDHSSKAVTKTPKQPELSSKKPKNEEEAFANYRQTHTANERRRRKEMRGLFEKLEATLGLHMVPKVSKCFILKQAFEEIQGLTDQADKLIGQKNLLIRKQEALIRKVSSLSGKTQEVVLKKLEYIYAKQKAVEAQKKQQQEAEPAKTAEPAAMAQSSAETSSSSLFREMKQMSVSSKRTKPLILARKRSDAPGETTTPVTLTNASLVMTAQGQVLSFKSSLMPGQISALPSTLLQAEFKSEVDSNSGPNQPGTASVMIQLPGSTVPVQVKGILPNSTVPITLSAVASSSASPVVETAPELTLDNEDSFLMPRIVNVTSLATEEDKHLNVDVNENPHIATDASSQASEPSLPVAPQETINTQSVEKAEASCGNGGETPETTEHFLRKKEIVFPQIVNVSSLKESPETFATKLCIEQLAQSQAEEKQTNRGEGRQQSKDSLFQELQVKEAKTLGIEMELQKVASAIQEAAPDSSDIMDIEDNDDTDETLTSLLNEIAFLNQQLNDDASEVSELPNSLSSCFSPGDIESHRESAAADGSPFQFGPLGGSFKDFSIAGESNNSITPLLLHLDDDELRNVNRNSRELSSESDALKIMLNSEAKHSDPSLSAVSVGESGKHMEPLPAKPTHVSPPVLQMKTNLEAGNTDASWRPMPKLAPLGLKAANFSLESEGQNTKVMPVLAPVASKASSTEIKTARPVTSPSQDNKTRPTLAPVATKSK